MADIIELGQWQVKKERHRHVEEKDKCNHKHMTMDKQGFTVRCDDCKIQLSAYWVLERMLDDYRSWAEKMTHAQERHADTLAKDLHLTAAREVERAWRSRGMVPCCPHCSRGIFPDDHLGGSMVSKELELARREKEEPRRWGGKAPAPIIKKREERTEKSAAPPPQNSDEVNP